MKTGSQARYSVIKWITGTLTWLLLPAIIWAIILYMLGGTDWVFGYLKIIGVLLVFALIGGGTSWIWKKLGGHINE